MTNISFTVEKQFPSIYREEGPQLVDLVKGYYEFLETQTDQSVYNIRRMSQFRDIDRTLDSMLSFFKNKFLNGIFIEENERFIVKNILDLYRRKGTNEGIELFFKLFFQEEVDIYYPSYDIFKPSASIWKVDSYIQLYAITDDNIENFSDITNKKIFGSVSKAEAFVDKIYFVDINQSLIPIIILDNIKSKFVSFDEIFTVSSTSGIVKKYGTVKGSLNSIEIVNGISVDNKIGDSVDILSAKGFGAKGIVTELSESIISQIVFEIKDGGFGYTISGANTEIGENEITLSNQSIFLDTGATDFLISERIVQNIDSNTVIYGTVVGKETDKIAVNLDNIATPFVEGYNIETVSRSVNISYPISFVTLTNDSATYEIGSINILDRIRAIPDIIGNFFDVQLDSNNYSSDTEMSGTTANAIIPNFYTLLSDAFIEVEMDVGEISTLVGIDGGEDHVDDTYSLVRQTFMSENYGPRKNQIIVLGATNIIPVLKDDILIQERTLTDWSGATYTKIVRAKVTDVVGDNVYLKPITLEIFEPTVDIFIEDDVTSLIVEAIHLDENNVSDNSIGSNALIEGQLQLGSGKMKKVDLVDSGFGYQNNGAVTIFNKDKKKRLIEKLSHEIPLSNAATQIQIELDRNEFYGDAIATSRVFSQGFSEGRYISSVSQISDKKVIQDSFYYQDYSYEISTNISVGDYKETFIDTMHPAGIKLFNKFLLINDINTNTDIETTVEIVSIS